MGQTASDAARNVRVFHLCKESHEVPAQHSCTDEDLIFESQGQTAYDAAQEHGHLCGDGGMAGTAAEKENRFLSERETGVCR